METKMTANLMRDVIGRLEAGTRADAEILASLRAENARLREALQGVMRAIIPLASGHRFTPERRAAVEQARAALAGR